MFFEIYGPEYLKGKSVRGDSRKKGLDLDVQAYVQYVVLNSYPMREGHTPAEIWQGCVNATNKAISDLLTKHHCIYMQCTPCIWKQFSLKVDIW